MIKPTSVLYMNQDKNNNTWDIIIKRANLQKINSIGDSQLELNSDSSDFKDLLNVEPDKTIAINLEKLPIKDLTIQEKKERDNYKLEVTKLGDKCEHINTTVEHVRSEALFLIETKNSIEKFEHYLRNKSIADLKSSSNNLTPSKQEAANLLAKQIKAVVSGKPSFFTNLEKVFCLSDIYKLESQLNNKFYSLLVSNIVNLKFEVDDLKRKKKKTGNMEELINHKEYNIEQNMNILHLAKQKEAERYKAFISEAQTPAEKLDSLMKALRDFEKAISSNPNTKAKITKLDQSVSTVAKVLEEISDLF